MSDGRQQLQVCTFTKNIYAAADTEMNNMTLISMLEKNKLILNRNKSFPENTKSDEKLKCVLVWTVKGPLTKHWSCPLCCDLSVDVDQFVFIDINKLNSTLFIQHQSQQHSAEGASYCKLIHHLQHLISCFQVIITINHQIRSKAESAVLTLWFLILLQTKNHNNNNNNNNDACY